MDYNFLLLWIKMAKHYKEKNVYKRIVAELNDVQLLKFDNYCKTIFENSDLPKSVNKDNLMRIYHSILLHWPDKDPDELMIRHQNGGTNEKVLISKGQEYYDKFKKDQSVHSKNIMDKVGHRMRPNSKEYWIYNGYSEEESLQKISETNKSAIIKSHKNRKANNFDYKSANKLCIEYWEKRNYDDPEERLKEFKDTSCNFSFGWFKNNYGGDWEKFRNSFNQRRISAIKEKYGTAVLSAGRKSKISIKFFDLLYEEMIKKFENLTMYGGNYGNEFRYTDRKTGKTYFYDFYIKEAKLLIEFNGLYWHAREKHEWLNNRLKYEDAIAYEEEKKKLVTDLGYELLYVWEDEDFEKRKDEIIAYTATRLHDRT